MMKQLLAAIALAAWTLVGHGAIIETTFSGTVTVSSDASDILGYGGGSAANGSRVTLTFRFDTATAPADFYGGARFPIEADYTNFVLPVWISAVVEFDNGFTLTSAGFDGSLGVQQQVKIQDNCVLCSFGPVGATAWDSYGNFIQIGTESAGGNITDTFVAGARVFDYTQSLINNLAIDQLVNWSPGAAGTYWADAQFAYRHVDRLNDANSFYAEMWQAKIDSVTSRVVPEPTTFALAALGLAGLVATRRRKQ